jgi:PAT family beta-lactamase induction signal transducer AmpG
MTDLTDGRSTTLRRSLPTWLKGFGNIPLGATGSIMLITVPELLAANHVPEAKIASVTAFGLFATFASFPFTPILDWRFSRRAYAVVLAIVGALFSFAALIEIHDLTALAVLLFASSFTVQLCINAVGGWFGNVTAPERKNVLGAWLAVANISAGGVVAIVALPLLRDLPYAIGAGLLSLTAILSLPLYFWQWCPPADTRLAHEGFRDFVTDVARLLRQRSVLWTLPLFLAPSAAFALTNTLGGFGAQFHTSEKLVGLIGGVGVTIAGVLGSLIIPPISRRVPPRVLYLMVGIVGAAFSLGCAFLPRTTVVFGVAFMGENVFQAAAFAVGNLIALRVASENPALAATGYGLLVAATTVPITYMQIVDGHAYDLGGVTGSFLADALVSGAACILLAGMLAVWRRRIPVV